MVGVATIHFVSPGLSSIAVELDDGFDDDEPTGQWLPPDDRLWRHPSEVAAYPWPESSRRGREPRAWTTAVLAAAISSLLTTGLIAASGGFRNRTTVVRSVESVALPVAQRSAQTGNNQIVDIAERIRPAIVQLDVDTADSKASGSGVMIRSDGEILTNNHVVQDARSISVIMADGREFPARVVGADADTDVAVVKVDGNQFATAPLGSADGLKVGAVAIAVGSPLGLAGGPSVSVGVISALGRQIDSHSGPSLLDMIQTDAPIAPGSSGGALLDNTGAVVGVTTAIAVSDVGAEGLGFATPIDIARDVADQLINTGKVVHVWLGVEGEDVTPQTSGDLGTDSGALVRKIRAGSPAAKSGIAVRDVITSIDGKPIRSMAALVVALRLRHPGDTAVLGIVHDGKPKTIRVTLAERPKTLT
ncbi:MAG TPA: trypsin-like peptidase domain-containing protein [Acidimicrobiia bacterium]|jgi:S1-C subfamily serine protease|nr:trypsin-like peptidase domain-containing protein [Acidimicrobiia bacterium]